jgi:predicted house-cleaning noncanonical NTP pyrophosphatase (MazG superfamily)
MTKLVRDKIPDIMRTQGRMPFVHTADDREYEEKLLEKLAEEVTEFIESRRSEELADILEVLYAICDLHKIELNEIAKIRREKKDERGGFRNRVILDDVSE